MPETKGKASTKAKNKYNAANYDSLRIVVPKGRKADAEVYARACGESVNGLVNTFLRQAIGMTEDEWKKAPDTTDGGA